MKSSLRLYLVICLRLFKKREKIVIKSSSLARKNLRGWDLWINNKISIIKIRLQLNYMSINKREALNANN